MQKSLKDEMQELRDLRDQNILSQKEFDREKGKILAHWHEKNKAPPAPPKTANDLLFEGMKIGSANARFKLIKYIGGGANGQIWKAVDLAEKKLMEADDKDCYKALKFLHTRLREAPEHLALLQKEAVRASSLSHENIINVTQFVQGPDGWAFIVMEYLQGETLNSYLHKQEHRKLSLDEMLSIIKPVAKALDFAHGKKICHRDLKPANIFLTDEDEVKILDFGLAYQIQRSSHSLDLENNTTRPSGTVEYMAPETFYSHEPKANQDIHALACVMYELLNSEPPFNQYKSPSRRADDPEPPKPGLINGMVWQVIQRGFSYDPEQRPKTAMAFIQDIENAQLAAERLKHQELQNRSKKVSPRQAKSRKKILFVALASMVAMTFTGITYFNKAMVADNTNDSKNKKVVELDLTKVAPVIPIPSNPKSVNTNKDNQVGGGTKNSTEKTRPVVNREAELITVITKKNDTKLDEIAKDLSKPKKEKYRPRLINEPVRTKLKSESSDVKKSKNGYAIQLMTTSSERRAKKLKNTMKKEGYGSFLTITTRNNKKLYRVRVRVKGNRNAAIAAQQKMKRRYKKNFFVQNSLVVSN